MINESPALTTDSFVSARVTQSPRYVSISILSAVAACLTIFSFTIWSIQNSSNQRAAAESTRLVSASLSGLVHALSNVNNDYSHWDDAYLSLSSRDVLWLYENYAVTATNSVLFDGVVFFGGLLDSPMAWTAANPQVTPSASFLPPEVLENAANEVARQTLGATQTFDFMTLVNGQLTLLSATRIQPSSSLQLESIDIAEVPMVILSKTLDASMLADIASSLSLKEISFTTQPISDRSLLPVRGPNGETLGAITWAPPRPGSEAVSTMTPVLISAALILVALGALAAWLARTYTRDLVMAEAMAQQIANKDILTGLPNRRGFHQHVQMALGQLDATNPNDGLAVLLLDLDRFKPVNDLRGHQAGDLLLCEVAIRLRSICPSTAFVARLGGDEFVIVLRMKDCAEKSSGLARKILARISEPFDFDDWSAAISCSIGVADWSAKASSSDLLREADQAMYRAKQMGGSGVGFYDEELGESLRERAALEQSLRVALDQGLIKPYFQPAFGDEGGQIQSVEVLARWIDPVRGFVPPDIFLPLAEEIGLMDRLSEMVLDSACLSLADWPTNLPISFNVSPRQFKDRSLPKRVLTVLRRNRIAASRLEIEITESALMEDMEASQEIIGEFVASGVSISIDRFGTGTSSLAILTQLYVSRIKIDRSFVAKVDCSPHNAKIVSALLGLAQILDLEVTAEGIERPEELKFLKERGCTLFQGYLLGHPQSGESISRLLVRNLASPPLPLYRSA